MKKVNEVMARFWIWVLGCFYGTSIRTRERFGAVIAWWAIPKRRHVALTNLRLCFPDWTEEKRVRIAKQNYRNMGRAALDHAVLWKGTKEELQAMVKFEGLDLVTDTDNRVASLPWAGCGRHYLQHVCARRIALSDAVKQSLGQGGA